MLNDDTAFVSCTPPYVTEVAKALFALMPTTSRLLLAAPALKLESVIWFDDDTVPEVVCILFKTMPPVVAVPAAVVGKIEVAGKPSVSTKDRIANKASLFLLDVIIVCFIVFLFVYIVRMILL